MKPDQKTSLLRSPLYEKHLALGARMTVFAGWEMPVQYKNGILAEHQHTRTHASLFDICHMGEFRIQGARAAEALDYALARAVADQPVGSCRYNFLLNEAGGTLDDLIVYRLGRDEFYLVVNAGTRLQDATVLRERLPAEITFVDESDTTAKLDLQGPGSAKVLDDLGIPRQSLPSYYHWMNASLVGIPILLSRTGYTGELGFELYFQAEVAEKIWDTLLSHPSVRPAGLGARDTLRLEMGYPLYGHELDPNTTPIECGFGGMLKLESSKRDFVGAEALRRKAPTKRLRGLVLEGRRAARGGMQVYGGSQAMGVVTSGAFAPSLGYAITLCFLEGAYAGLIDGSSVEVDFGGGHRGLARLESPPFYKKGTVRFAI